MADFDPSTPSAEHAAMSPQWRTVRDVLGGAVTMRAAGTRYLPTMPREAIEDWRYRVATSPFVNIYGDIAANIAAKPFANEVAVAATSPARIKELAEDIDAGGNSLHVFSERLFYTGLNDAISWILVDHTRVPDGATRADEKALGARPYWVAIEAPDMLSAQWAMVDGELQIIEARIAERDDDTARNARHVRILKREKTETGYAKATWELWREHQGQGNVAPTWEMVDGGPLAIGIVPLVPFQAGRRALNRIVPILGDVLELQIEHFQRESALKAARTMTAFPMLSASGISPPADGLAISVGPSVVLYGPPNAEGQPGTWTFVEPSATSLKFLSEDIDRLEQQMRELGRQPLTAQSGNLTVVTTQFAASKANNVVEALALNLKDALEQALKFTCKWLGTSDQPSVALSTDFDTGMLGETGAETLLKMHETNSLSTRTLWAEMRRRNILSPNFDPNAEEAAILAEIPGDDGGDARTAAMT